MLNRIKWIVVSYVTRPLMWAMAAFGASFFFLLRLSSFDGQTHYQTTFPDQPLGPMIVNSQKTLDEVRRSGRQQDVTAVYLSALWNDQTRLKAEKDGGPRAQRPPEDFFRILEEFPNLRAVEYCFGGPTSFDYVARCAGLEYLLFDDISAPDLARLRPLKNLRRIDFQTSKPSQDIGQLAALPKLEMIVFGSDLALNDAVLAGLAELPHLKVLVLDIKYFRPLYPPFSRSGLVALAESPSLKTVYLGGLVPKQHREVMAIARESLPHISIVSGIYDMRWLPHLLMCLTPLVFVALAIGIQLSSQFRGPFSRLAPAFPANHALVAIVFVAGAVALAATGLVSTGAEIAPAFALSAALAATVIANTPFTSLVDCQRLQGLPRKLTWISSFVLTGTMAVLAVLIVPAAAQYVLSANNPVVLSGLVLWTIAAVVFSAWALSLLVFGSSASTDSMRGTFLERVSQSIKYREGQQFDMQRGERKIEESLREGARWNWWNRVQRWRAGNRPQRRFRFALFVIGVMAVGMRMFQYLAAPDSNLYDFVAGPWLCVTAGIVSMSVCFQVVMIWRTRLLTLPLELLRPFSRRAIQSEMAAAFIADLAPLAIVSAAVAALGINLGADFSIAWQWVPLDFLVLFGAGFDLVVGVAAMLVVVRRLWLGMILAGTVAYVTVFAVFALALLMAGPSNFMPTLPRNHMSTILTRGALEAGSWIPLLIGAIVCYLTGRRWLRMEMNEGT